MLRLGIDAWNLPHDRRGIGRYVRALVTRFAEDYRDRVACTLIVPEWPAWSARAAYRRAIDGLRLPLRSRRYADRSDLDVLWFPFNGVSWETFSIAAVATLHDATTFVLPGYDDAARAPFRRAAARCARIITDSRHAADELARELPFPRERIDPIPLGVAPARPVEPVALDLAALGRYVLFVGEAEPRKGLPTLAASVTRLRAEGIACRLVAVGRIPEGTTVPEETLLLGHVDDATLGALYRGCAAFAYPSRYEGFGLPVLEAMRYGAPVVASSASAIPEAAGDAAAYVPPDDVGALEAALRRVLTEPGYAEELRALGFTRAEAMTWDATAAATLAVLERVAAEHHLPAR